MRIRFASMLSNLLQDDGESQSDQFAGGSGGSRSRIDSKSLPFRKNLDSENDPSADKWSKASGGSSASKKHAVPLDKV